MLSSLAVTAFLCVAPEVTLVPDNGKLVKWDLIHVWLATEGCRAANKCTKHIELTLEQDGTRSLNVTCTEPPKKA